MQTYHRLPQTPPSPRIPHMFGLMWTPSVCCTSSSSSGSRHCRNAFQQPFASFPLLLLLLPLLLLLHMSPFSSSASIPNTTIEHPGARVLVLLEHVSVDATPDERATATVTVDLLHSSLLEYARVLGVLRLNDDDIVRDDNQVIFRLSNGLGDLWVQLNELQYSTIIYAMRDDAAAVRSPRNGLCAMASELSIWHQKRVLFWPCQSTAVAAALGNVPRKFVKLRKPQPQPFSSTFDATTTSTTLTMSATTTTASAMVDAMRHVLTFMNATRVAIVTRNDDEWLLPVSVAVSLSGLPHTFAHYADFFNNATAPSTVDDMQAPGTVIISTDDPIIVPLLAEHVLRHSNRTRAVLVDMRANAVRRRSADTCSTAVVSADAVAVTVNARVHVSPHNPHAINSSSSEAAAEAAAQEPHQSPSVYLLTVLSTGFRQYLELLIKQQSIERQHWHADEGVDATTTIGHESPPHNGTDGEHVQHSRQRRRRRRRQAIEIANEIKSTVNSDGDKRLHRRPSSPDAAAALDVLRPVTNGTAVELSPEIIARIKQFYGSSVADNSTLSSPSSSPTPSALNIYEYCQRFVSSSYHLDANTTALVCDILLQDDTMPQLSLADEGATADDDGADDADDDDDRIGDNNDADADDADGAEESSAATESSVPAIVIHAAECQTAVKWFALFDFIIANVMDRSGSQTPPPTTTTTATFGIAPEFSLLPYSTADGGVWQWPPVLRVTAETTTAGALEPYTKNNGSGSPPPLSSSPGAAVGSYVNWVTDGLQMFWRCGVHCWTVTSLVVLTLLLTIVGCIVAAIAMRNYLLKKRLSRGPNKIVLSVTDFVFPVEGRCVDEGIEAMLCCWLQQLQEFGGPEVEKPDLLKGSIGSLKNLGLTSGSSAPGTVARTAGRGGCGNCVAGGGAGFESGSGSLSKHRNVMDMRARYNGDLVQLKDMPMGPSIELKSRAMDHLVMTHGLRHENINPLVGWLSDPNRNAMVFECCSRGSLQDVLIMDDIKLDWSFRLSLLTDLVRGMRYLHSSPMRVHGALTSRNCVVDARWVLKITDYGLQTFRDIQGIVTPARTTKELLWTAPEMVRHMRGSPSKFCPGTQLGDVYSFGIIMQEVVVRGEPYCMLSLTPEEIIAKIEKPPPLIRPSVSKGAAPPEAINIMRQCWAENPEMRPDFNSVYERFKILNHGRKVNFVDTMFQMLEKYSNNLEELIRERTGQLEIERKKTEQLLNRMLPSSVAERLKMGLSVEPEEFSEVTIYFSDIVGFTTIAAHCTPVEVVDLLNDLYTCFDDTINAYSVYKVETIGDAYMVVSGLPVRQPDHAEQIATMALDLLHQSGNFHVKHLPDVPLQLRIGLHTGPCCAGVVGLTMPRYCLFGDTVNTASRMESTGSSWRIHLSEATRERLVQAGGYELEPRGPIEIKGKGLMHTYWLLGKSGFDKVLPTPPPIGESHGLAECLLRNVQPNGALSPTSTSTARTAPTSAAAAVTVTSRLVHSGLTHQSSSQSSSQCGAELVDVKVEITPPHDSDKVAQPLINSFSMDSNCLSSDFKTPPQFASPQIRKLSDMPATSHDICGGPGGGSSILLNASGRGGCGVGGAAATGVSPSASNSATKLYKKIEEMMDLSSPYNHYRCLSACPSESNLTQYNQPTGGEHRYAYGGGGGGGGGGVGAGIGGGSATRLEIRPGSSRLLRRQFSLDRDDCAQSQQLQPTVHHYRYNLEIPTLQEHRTSPTNSAKSMTGVGNSLGVGGGGGRLLKQHSTSVAIDLEKIDEAPISPTSLLSSGGGGRAGGRLNSGLQSQASEETTGSRTPTERNDELPMRPAAAVQRNSNEISLTVDALIVR